MTEEEMIIKKLEEEIIYLKKEIKDKELILSDLVDGFFDEDDEEE